METVSGRRTVVAALAAWLTARSPLLEYSVMVPRNLNDGVLVPPELRAHIEDTMGVVFKGYTALRHLDGLFIDDDGEEFDDVVDEYRVAARRRSAVLTFAREVGVLLDQRSVYVRCPNGQVAIVRVKRARPWARR